MFSVIYKVVLQWGRIKHGVEGCRYKSRQSGQCISRLGAAMPLPWKTKRQVVECTLRKKVITPISRPKIQCIRCGRWFRSRHILQAHKKVCEKSCKVCKEIFCDRRKFKVHYKKCHLGQYQTEYGDPGKSSDLEHSSGEELEAASSIDTVLSSDCLNSSDEDEEAKDIKRELTGSLKEKYRNQPVQRSVLINKDNELVIVVKRPELSDYSDTAFFFGAVARTAEGTRPYLQAAHKACLRQRLFMKKFLGKFRSGGEKK